MSRRLLTFLIPGIAVPLFGWLLYRQLSRYSVDDIVASIAAIPMDSILLAGVFAACSYVCLTGFDALATRYAGYRFPYPKVALASFISLSIGHNVGIAALSSGAIRYRFYKKLGMKMGDVAKVVLFCGITVALGLLSLAGMALLLNATLAGDILGLGRWPVIFLGSACLLANGLYLLLSAFVKRPLTIRDWTLELPDLPLAMGQVVIGLLNYLCVSACLYFTLSALADVGYVSVATAYVIANGTALISHIPGGLGVLEGMVMYLLPNADVIGALVVFRVVYFLVPLAIGAPLFALIELGRLARRRRAERPTKPPDDRAKDSLGQRSACSNTTA